MSKFTPEEDKFLRDNYLTIPAKRMSKILNRSESSARQRMALIGIVVPKEVADRFKKDSQLKAGNTPMNKGRKQADYMSAESIAKTASTRFKKGDTPHNTQYDGYERITKDGYVEVRIRKGKFMLKHRFEWEKLHGKIPKGYLIVCKGDDITNCNPNNWELISMVENMKRNSATTNLPDSIVACYMATKSRNVNHDLRNELLNYPELLDIKRQDILLNRQIKEMQK